MKIKTIVISFILIASGCFIISIFLFHHNKMKQALTDSSNQIIYNYLSDNRKFMILDYPTKIKTPVN